MLVCARCAGIYTGALLGTISCLLVSINFLKRRIIILSALPLLFDVILVNLEVYPYSKLLSFLSGLIFGSIIYLAIILELEKMIHNKN